jgi:hypothetical protein
MPDEDGYTALKKAGNRKPRVEPRRTRFKLSPQTSWRRPARFATANANSAGSIGFETCA